VGCRVRHISPMWLNACTAGSSTMSQLCSHLPAPGSPCCRWHSHCWCDLVEQLRRQIAMRSTCTLLITCTVRPHSCRLCPLPGSHVHLAPPWPETPASSRTCIQQPAPRQGRWGNPARFPRSQQQGATVAGATAAEHYSQSNAPSAAGAAAADTLPDAARP
jgi:hypothetical protein